jgi:hypothetical protein
MQFPLTARCRPKLKKAVTSTTLEAAFISEHT